MPKSSILYLPARLAMRTPAAGETRATRPYEGLHIFLTERLNALIVEACGED